MAKEPTPMAFAGTLPDEEANGLIEIVRELAAKSYEERAKIRYAVVAWNISDVKDKTETRRKTPVVAIRRVEAATEDDERRLVEAMLLKRFQQRTGHLPQGSLTSADPDQPSFFDNAPTADEFIGDNATAMDKLVLPTTKEES